jgi:steroid delta-isomerase-like uncharacterized protein
VNADTERKRATVSVWRAAWDEGKVDALDDLLAPSYRRHSNSSDAIHDREQFKASITSTRQAFPDLVTTIDDMVEEGDRLAIRWHSEGTHTGAMLGVPPTRRSVVVYGVTFAHFSGDQVVEEWVTWDPRQLLTALGVITVGGGS